MKVQSDRFVNDHIRALIRQRRITLGLTQGDLADRLGVTYQQVCKYESGANQLSPGRLKAASEALEIPIVDFFDTNRKVRAAAAPRTLLTITQIISRIKDPKALSAISAVAKCFVPD